MERSYNYARQNTPCRDSADSHPADRWRYNRRSSFGAPSTAMPAFQNAREAIDFLAAQIVEEAACEGVSFSDAERRMLYFTESDDLLSDMREAEAQFDARYDQNEYEAKVSRLMASLYRRLRKESSVTWKSWNAAIRFLEEHEHYVLVMVERAKASQQVERRRWKRAGHIATSVFDLLLGGLLERKYQPIEKLYRLLEEWYHHLPPDAQTAVLAGTKLLAVLLILGAIVKYREMIRRMRSRQRLRTRAFSRMTVNLHGRLVETGPEGVHFADEERQD